MKLVVAEKAWADLDRSLEYVLEHFGAEVALRVEGEVLAALKLLRLYPRGGQIEPWLEHLGMGHRRVVIGPLKIIYRIEGDTVIVPEIFDSRQDPKRMKG